MVSSYLVEEMSSSCARNDGFSCILQPFKDMTLPVVQEMMAWASRLEKDSRHSRTEGLARLILRHK